MDRKTEKDLQFIQKLSRTGEKKGFNVVIRGGYATDASLGKITRRHEDIDCLVFGNDGDIKTLIRFVFGVIGKEVEYEDEGRQEFFHPIMFKRKGGWVNTYYLQVAGDPFFKKKKIVKDDGSITEAQEHGEHKIILEGYKYQVVPPEDILNEIQNKRLKGYNKLTKHDSDIANLESLLKR